MLSVGNDHIRKRARVHLMIKRAALMPFFSQYFVIGASTKVGLSLNITGQAHGEMDQRRSFVFCLPYGDQGKPGETEQMYIRAPAGKEKALEPDGLMSKTLLYSP